jgi:hypothetical protein
VARRLWRPLGLIGRGFIQKAFRRGACLFYCCCLLALALALAAALALGLGVAGWPWPGSVAGAFRAAGMSEGGGGAFKKKMQLCSSPFPGVLVLASPLAGSPVAGRAA